MKDAPAAARTSQFVSWSEDGCQVGQSSEGSMSYQQPEPCAESSVSDSLHVEQAAPKAHMTAVDDHFELHQASNSRRSSLAGNPTVRRSTESATNSTTGVLSMVLTLSVQDASQQGSLGCSSQPSFPEYAEPPILGEAQAKQLVAPALSLDGTIWPRLPATEAVTPPESSQQCAATTAAGNRTSSFTVPHLRLTTLAETGTDAARASLHELEASLSTFNLLSSSNPSSPAHVIQANAAAQQAAAAALEDRWTQNTARALRQAQQEMRELCTAQGLPLPAERPYCFDVVGIRAAGYGSSSSSNSRPIASCGGSSALAAGKSNNGHSTGGSGSGVTSSAGMTSSSGSTSSANGVRPAAAVMAVQSLTGPEAGSASGLPSPASPVAAVPGLLQQLQQRRGQTLLGQLQQQQEQEEEQQTKQQRRPGQRMHPRSAGGLVKSSTAWDETRPWQHQQQQGAEQQQHPSKSVQVPYEQQQQVWQASLRPRSAGAAVKANGAWCDTWPWQRKQQQQQQQQQRLRRRPHSSRDIATRGQVSRTTRKGAQDSDGANVDDLLRCVERSLAVHEQHLSKDAAACVRRGGLSYQLPERWWETDSKALSDPLLLQMPVWMRQALDLELMP